MAGTLVGVSNTQQHDINGQPLASCILTVYQGGTTNLANVYQDIGLLLAAPNPMTGDASGRLPLFYLADGTYAARLTDQYGVQTNGGFYYPQIPSIGASTSGGGGTPVDPTTVFSTGMWTWKPDSSTMTGWVRLNGRTIGNAASGASERANADTQALFTYIWATYVDTICPVLGGRGANALADFNANKQITLLDMRGRAPFGLDDMGNAALNAFTGITFTKGNATTGGSSGGSNSITLVTANLPPYTPAGAITNGSISTAITNGGATFTNSGAVLVGGGGSFFAPTVTALIAVSTQAPSTFTGTAQGGSSTPAPAVPSAVLGSHFWKL